METQKVKLVVMLIAVTAVKIPENRTNDTNNCSNNAR